MFQLLGPQISCCLVDKQKQFENILLKSDSDILEQMKKYIQIILECIVVQMCMWVF